MKQTLILLSAEESSLRVKGVRTRMKGAGIDAALVRDFANLYYLTGRVFDGYIYITTDAEQAPIYFVKRPVHLAGDGVVSIAKPENMAATLDTAGLNLGV